MAWLSLLGIAVGLAMDAFAVAIAAGMSIAPVTPRHTFRLAFHFGLFQFMMPLLGWFAGREMAALIGGYDHWAAFALLTFVGGKMLWEAGHGEPSDERSDPTRGWMLVTLSVATSIDALAVGLSMALSTGVLGAASMWVSAVVIGIVAAAFTTVGITFGSRIGARWGRWAEIFGGCVLVLIGVEVLFSHLEG